MAGPTSTPLSELASAPEAGGALPGYGLDTLPGGTTGPDAAGGSGPGTAGGAPGGETLPGGGGGAAAPVTSVPEPATWLMMIAGIAFIGMMSRARNRRRARRRAA